MNIEKLKKKIMWGCLAFFMALAGPMTGFCADVDVYGEGVIIDNELMVYVYADVNVDQVVSYGISVNYDANELSVMDAQKDLDPIPYTSNPTKWYIGDSAAAYRNNPSPDSTVPGEVIIIGGKIDPTNPEQGVSQGQRVFLAMVKFGPVSGQIPVNPTLYLSYARGDGTATYKNFVRLNSGTPEVLDGANVYFGAVDVFMQGDTDGNGRITPRDIAQVKANIDNPNSPCYTDCDGNGRVTPRDIACVKTKIN